MVTTPQPTQQRRRLPRGKGRIGGHSARSTILAHRYMGLAWQDVSSRGWVRRRLQEQRCDLNRSVRLRDHGALGLEQPHEEVLAPASIASGIVIPRF
jgi:hypothetical protein